MPSRTEKKLASIAMKLGLIKEGDELQVTQLRPSRHEREAGALRWCATTSGWEGEGFGSIWPLSEVLRAKRLSVHRNKVGSNEINVEKSGDGVISSSRSASDPGGFKPRLRARARSAETLQARLDACGRMIHRALEMALQAAREYGVDQPKLYIESEGYLYIMDSKFDTEIADRRQDFIIAKVKVLPANVDLGAW